jgi:hypothetical protein
MEIASRHFTGGLAAQFQNLQYIIFLCRKDTAFYRHHQIFKDISSVMDEKSKPTFAGGAC